MYLLIGLALLFIGALNAQVRLAWAIRERDPQLWLSGQSQILSMYLATQDERYRGLLGMAGTTASFELNRGSLFYAKLATSWFSFPSSSQFF